MPAYTINAVGQGGKILSPHSAETAREALDKLRATRPLFPRVWVSDEEGNDVAEGELMTLAAEEGKQA